MRSKRIVFATMLACACSGRIVGEGEGGSTTSATESTSGPVTSASTAATSATTATSADASTTVGSTSLSTSGASGESTGGMFVCDPDAEPPRSECDIWLEDCPCGEKCMPWANDGGSSWNATKCAPIAPDPKKPGEPCTVEGSAVSGIDDCELHAMCWDVDPETLMGTCIAMCIGEPNDPDCANPCDVCMVAGEGSIIPCFPKCDPVAQDCEEGQGCYPFQEWRPPPRSGQETFACAPDASGRPDLGVAGDPCEYINVCDPGLFCALPDVVPGCEAALGCCASFCDPTAADPCPNAPPGVECVPWYSPETLPTDDCHDWANVGGCMLPQ